MRRVSWHAVAGSILCCTGDIPHPVGFFTKNVMEDDIYQIGDIDFIYGPIPQSGSHPKCECGAPIYHSGPVFPNWVIHLE